MRFSSGKETNFHPMTAERLRVITPARPQRATVRAEELQAAAPAPARAPALAPSPAPKPEPAPSGDLNFADFTFRSEARTNKDGNLVPYELPSNDGGAVAGDNIEVAGMTPRYNKKERDELLSMLKSGEDSRKVKARWAEMMDEKVKPAEKLAGDPVGRFMAQDMVFHRGATGARLMFDYARRNLGYNEQAPPEAKVQALTKAAQWWETVGSPTFRSLSGKTRLQIAEKPEQFWSVEKLAPQVRANMQTGLENRFQNRAEYALTIARQNRSKKKGATEIDRGPYVAGNTP